MSLRKVSNGALLFSAVLLTFTPLLSTEAQDVDVPGNLTMRDSTGPTVGNVLKGGVSFIHNFGDRNTFIGSNAGNLTMIGPANTAMGVNARFTPISTPVGANWVQSKTTFRPTCSVLEGGADNFLSVKEAATRLGLCPASIYKICQHGELPHIRVLNAIRIAPADLAAFIYAHRTKFWGTAAALRRRP